MARTTVFGASAAGLVALVAGCVGTTSQSGETHTLLIVSTPPVQLRTSLSMTATNGLKQGASTIAPTEKAPAERMMIYVIQEGDTLSALAERWMAGASRWPEIVAANPDLIPEKLRIGRAIRLPIATPPQVQ